MRRFLAWPPTGMLAAFDGQIGFASPRRRFAELGAADDSPRGVSCRLLQRLFHI